MKTAKFHFTLCAAMLIIGTGSARQAIADSIPADGSRLPIPAPASSESVVKPRLQDAIMK